MTTMPIPAILAIIILLECALASASTDTCNTTLAAMEALLHEDLHDMTLESNVQIDLAGTRGRVLSAVFEPVSSTGKLRCNCIITCTHY